MRLLIQRVRKAEVKVKEKSVGKIDKGLFILVGAKEGDKIADAEVLAEKISKIRLMPDENQKMNLSLKDAKASVLAVSQFTLYGDTRKGNRPSFIKAANPAEAQKIYEHFVKTLKKLDLKIETGKFGEYMDISVELDGPVTIILESTNGKIL